MVHPIAGFVHGERKSQTCRLSLLIQRVLHSYIDCTFEAHRQQSKSLLYPFIFTRFNLNHSKNETVTSLTFVSSSLFRTLKDLLQGRLSQQSVKFP